MEVWQRLLAEGASSVAKLKRLFPHVDEKKLAAVVRQYPVRVNAYYLSLIEHADDPIARQVLPDIDEILAPEMPEDPLEEEAHSPAPGITHRYPDRVLFYVNYQCPVYCRYCTRKRKVGDPASMAPNQIESGLAYIRSHPDVREVILSGGDPLLLKDDPLDDLLGKLRAIPHVEIIRIGTRVPNALPQRVTPELCARLRKHHPVFVMVHFSHPRELTPEAARACNLLADHGFPLMNQTVLLRGVNDDAEILRDLFRGLLRLRVKPYYLYQADLVQGATHFRTSVEKGLEIMDKLRGRTSGLAVPYFVIDAPGGGGKVPLLPPYLLSTSEHEVVVRNFEGRVFHYPLPPVEGLTGAPARRTITGTS